MPPSKTRKDKASQLTSKKTGSYKPLSYSFMMRPRDLPPFDFMVIQAMLWDPMVRLGLAMRSAPIYLVEFGHLESGKYVPGVWSPVPEVAEFVQAQLAKIWLTSIDHIVKSQIWGWVAGEVMLSLNGGRIEFQGFLPRHANDTRALIQDGEVKGVRVLRVPGVEDGRVDLDFPKAMFIPYSNEDGRIYGDSVMIGAYSPWSDKWFDGGALDVRRLFMRKDAYGGADLSYPEGSMYIEGKGEVPNRDIAREIVEQMLAGSVTTRPSGVDPDTNTPLWQLTRATTPNNPAHILSYPKDLDLEILHGLEIPDEVLMSSTSGSWEGKKIPMLAFTTGLDRFVRKILFSVDSQVVRRLVYMNYGPIDYQVVPRPLADTLMELFSDNPKAQPIQSPIAMSSSRRVARAIKMALQRAPKGGVTLKGRFFHGGEFIPKAFLEADETPPPGIKPPPPPSGGGRPPGPPASGKTPAGGGEGPGEDLLGQFDPGLVSMSKHLGVIVFPSPDELQEYVHQKHGEMIEPGTVGGYDYEDRKILLVQQPPEQMKETLALQLGYAISNRELGQSAQFMSLTGNMPPDRKEDLFAQAVQSILLQQQLPPRTPTVLQQPGSPMKQQSYRRKGLVLTKAPVQKQAMALSPEERQGLAQWMGEHEVNFLDSIHGQSEGPVKAGGTYKLKKDIPGGMFSNDLAAGQSVQILGAKTHHTQFGDRPHRHSTVLYKDVDGNVQHVRLHHGPMGGLHEYFEPPVAGRPAAPAQTAPTQAPSASTPGPAAGTPAQAPPAAATPENAAPVRLMKSQMQAIATSIATTGKEGIPRLIAKMKSSGAFTEQEIKAAQEFGNKILPLYKKIDGFVPPEVIKLINAAGGKKMSSSKKKVKLSLNDDDYNDDDHEDSFWWDPHEEVTDPHEKAKRDWAKSLTTDDIRAFHMWLYEDPESLRHYEKTGKGLFLKPKHAKGIMDTIHKALDRGVPYKGPVYRGLADVHPKHLKKLTPGTEFPLDATSSFTGREDTAKNFMVGQGKKGHQGVLLKVKNNLSGIHVNHIAYDETEDEVISRKGTKYRVLNSYPSKDLHEGEPYHVVELEEVPADKPQKMAAWSPPYDYGDKEFDYFDNSVPTSENRIPRHPKPENDHPVLSASSKEEENQLAKKHALDYNPSVHYSPNSMWSLPVHPEDAKYWYGNNNSDRLYPQTNYAEALAGSDGHIYKKKIKPGLKIARHWDVEIAKKKLGIKDENHDFYNGIDHMSVRDYLANQGFHGYMGIHQNDERRTFPAVTLFNPEEHTEHIYSSYDLQSHPEPEPTDHDNQPVMENHEEWVNSVDEAEREALEAWTYGAWDNMRNWELDKGNHPAAKYRLNALYKALARAPKFKGEIYRGIANLEKEDIESLTQIGSVIDLEATSSFSADFRIANKFAGGDEGLVFAVKNNQSGVDIVPFSKYAHEEEVLVRKGTKYRIVGIQPKQTEYDLNVVELEEIPREQQVREQGP